MRSVSLFSLCAASVFTVQAAQAADCSNLSAWDSGIAYTGGAQVQYSGEAYRANWWSRGENPAANSGQYQSWSALGACDGGNNGGDPNLAPTADAGGPYSATLGNAIAFDSSASSDSDGNIATYSWDFGDGNSSTQASPSYTYAAAGNYSVSLIITDNDGATASASTSATVSEDGGSSSDCNAPNYRAGTAYSAGDVVTNVGHTYTCNIAGWCSSSSAWAYEPGVGSAWQQAWSDNGQCDGTGPVNQAPSANAGGPYSGTVNTAISFTGTGSDSDGTIASYSWSFGDGATATGANVSHSYANAGSYSVSFTVTDNDGASTTASAQVDVVPVDQNQPPVAQVNGPFSEDANVTLNLSSAGSSDPDGSIVSYDWNFGDGATSTLANPSHSYSADGNYTITLTVTDDEGATDSAVTSARIGNTNVGTGGDKVVGYFVEWGIYGRNYHIKDIVTSGSADKLTHLVYAFGNVKNGQCVMDDSYAATDKAYDAAGSVDGVADSWESGAVRGNFGQIKRLKQMYPDLKVVWSFGGWTYSSGFGQAAQNPQQFAQSCYDLVFDPRWEGVFDGIDIDWEYPNACGLECDNSGFDAYRELLAALRAEFGNKLVTSAIGAGEAKLNAADYGGAAQYLDFYMLMTYDFFGAWAAEGPTAPHSALYTYDGIPQQGFTSDNGIQTLKSLGVPAEKILLGIGFYGRGWTGVTQSAPGGTATGPANGTYEDGIEDYKVLKNTCPSTGTFAGTAYAHCGNNWWSYDTPATIISKMNYVDQQGLGGAFFWELSGDTSDGELIEAIGTGLGN
ncbi:glycosyl hydrolase family 18 protein [Gilvimarinus algae]|uniref:chitinase n=1 Tax=Gilvimarinus algae TaxID=3058037 RepID=A0ABT8TBY0_9GAMM|nr:glycosyl hydrolase family 18 protein [Gilvimarinus sp. SDUM040014]MDO3381614.1 glycosyl hydrolase family 18 protein [Gilvimarinus sp. SDUM040014]